MQPSNLSLAVPAVLRLYAVLIASVVLMASSPRHHPLAALCSTFIVKPILRHM